MPANEKDDRVQGTLLPKGHGADAGRGQGAFLQGARDVNDDRGQGPLLQHQGHRALRKGRISIANGVYLVTATTIDRQKLFADFGAGVRGSAMF